MLKSKIFSFFLLACCSAAPLIGAAEGDDEAMGNFPHGMAIRHVAFNNHDYIVFNNKFFVHDPDCSCKQRLIGWLEKRGNDWVIHLKREVPSDFD